MSASAAVVAAGEEPDVGGGFGSGVLDGVVDPLRAVAGHVRELAGSGLAEQVEELAQGGRGAVLGRS